MFIKSSVAIFLALVLGSAIASAKQVDDELVGGGVTTAKQNDFTPARLGNIGLGVGYEYGYFDYHEPGLMHDSGSLNGVKVEYVTPVRDVPFRLRAESDLIGGQVSYDGATWAGDKLADTMTDLIFNIRALGGYSFKADELSLTPELGLAYRYLNDNGTGSGSYEREISYLYLPIGLSLDFDANETFSYGISGEYDVFLSGTVKTHLSDYDSSLPDLTNTQSQGSGYRFAGHVSMRLKQASLKLEPYWQHWSIGASDSQQIDATHMGEEPANFSDQYGLSVMVIL